MKCSQLEYSFIHLTNVQRVPPMCQAVFLTPSSGVFALPSDPSSLGISNTAVLMDNVKDLCVMRRILSCRHGMGRRLLTLGPLALTISLV